MPPLFSHVVCASIPWCKDRMTPTPHYQTSLCRYTVTHRVLTV